MANSSYTLSANIDPLLKWIRSSTVRSEHVKNAAFSLSE